MKLKAKYILRTVADKTVAIAIEQGNKETDGVITLNETGAFIFTRINNGADFNSIVEDFLKEYELTPAEAEKAVRDFVEYLTNADLLEDDGQKTIKF